MRSHGWILCLLAHIAVLDEQIDKQEVELFRTLAAELQVTEEEQAQAERIFSDTADKLSLEAVVHALGAPEHAEAQRQALYEVLHIAYSDGFLDPREEHLVDQLVRAWKISPEEIQAMKLSLQQASPALLADDKEQRVQNRFMASTGLRLLQGLRSVGVRQLDERIEGLANRLLLSGPEYGKAIESSARVARTDFELSRTHLEQHWQGLSNLRSQLDKVLLAIRGENDDESQTYRQALSDLNVQLQSVVLTGMEESRRALYKKQRAMNMFTISFLGKTKAGKSTLHAVVTGEGFEAIGKGRQRTTRFNRVYRWKQVRIIDTPGIEAPQDGGELDARIALGVVDESDVICFVLINDSQQTPELDVLGAIRDRNKPVVILLNVKENLAEPVRLKKFLENPDQWHTRQDAQAVRGHVERIERYARDRYKGGPVRVIPVQLLAARMSRQAEHAQHAPVLFKASRIQHFLDALRVSVIDEGLLRRSQTLLDGTRYNLHGISEILKEKTAFLGEAVRRLEERRRQFGPKLEQAHRSHAAALASDLTGIFGRLRESVWDFAYSHCDESEDELQSAWEAHVSRFGLQDLVRGAVEKAVENYVDEVKQTLDEVTMDFHLLAGEMGDLSLSGGDTSSLRGVFKFLGMGLGAVAAILMLTPFGWVGAVVGLAGALLGWIGGLFKSKEQKRREAAEKIRTALSESVDNMERQYREKVGEHMSQVHRTVKAKLDRSLATISAALQGFDVHVQPVLQGLAASCSDLDIAYSYRVLQFALHGNDAPESLDQATVRRVVRSVRREFGRRIAIETTVRLSPRDQQRMTDIIGEEISLVAGGK